MNSRQSSHPEPADEASAGGGEWLPRIARSSVASAVGQKCDQAIPPRTGFLGTAHPVFVTIRDSAGRLRGCIGTLAPRCSDVVAETWRLAREAAFSDTRFAPVTRSEVDDLRFEVSVVQPLELIAGPGDLDPGRYGVVVSTPDGRRGALLPAVEGIDTIDRQLSLARRKGGIGADEAIIIQRFETVHYQELDPASGSPAAKLGLANGPDRS